MPTEPAETTTTAAQATSGDALPGGRLGMLTAFALGAAWIPVPVLPDRLLLQIRGAVAQDALARHGLSLTSDARHILAQPKSDHPTLRRAAETLTIELLRRLNPVGAVTAAARGFEVYALGLLLDHYVRRHRRASAVRVHADEARRLREALDRAVRRFLSPALQASLPALPAAAEDLRDEFTRWIDAFLLTGASAPEFVDRRLEKAFDEVIASGFAHG